MTVILLPLPPTSNNLFAGNGRRRYRTKEYDAWIKEAGVLLATQRPLKWLGKVSMLIEVREPPTMRAEDCCNREKATTDLLVKHGIIEGDSQHFVRRVIIQWANDIKGIRVTIERME